MQWANLLLVFSDGQPVKDEYKFKLEFQRITSYCFVLTKLVMKLCSFVSGRKYPTYMMLKTKLVFSLFDPLLTLKIIGFYSQDNYHLIMMLYDVLYVANSKRYWPFFTVKKKNWQDGGHFGSKRFDLHMVWFATFCHSVSFFSA